jgi:hypothetical protein
MHMKKTVTAILLSIILFSNTSHAQFTGCYAAANWTVNNANTNGSLYSTTNYFDLICDTDGSGNNVQGVDCSTTNNGNVSVCITVPASGTIGFTWTWTGGNNATLLTEPFGYCRNNVATDLTNGSNYTGTASVPVSMGDNFCFVLSSQFANSHPTLFTHVNINTFSGPCNPTGAQEIKTGEKNIFVQSPFSNTLIVKGTQLNAMVSVYDAQGREIICRKATEEETIISTEKFSAGVYVVRYWEGERQVFARVVKY